MIITQIILFNFITNSNIISNINDHHHTFIRLLSSLKSFFSISLPLPTSSQTSMIITRILFDYDHHSNRSFLFHYHFQHHLKHQWSSIHYCSTMIITQIILFHFITNSNIISNINDHHHTFVRLWSSLKSFFSISLPLRTSSETSMIIKTLLCDYEHRFVDDLLIMWFCDCYMVCEKLGWWVSICMLASWREVAECLWYGWNYYENEWVILAGDSIICVVWLYRWMCMNS